MKVEAWLVMACIRSTYKTYQNGPYQGQNQVLSVKATGLRQSKPSLGSGEIAFKVEFDVDESWFLDGIATIKATVPPVSPSNDIQATVDIPVKPRAKSPAAARVQHP